MVVYIFVDKCEMEFDKVYLINGIGVYYILFEVENIGVRFIYISIDYVFSGKGIWFYQIDDFVDFGMIYGKSKKFGEELIWLMGKNYIIIRILWVYGSGGNNFVNMMLKFVDIYD